MGVVMHDGCIGPGDGGDKWMPPVDDPMPQLSPDSLQGVRDRCLAEDAEERYGRGSRSGDLCSEALRDVLEAAGGSPRDRRTSLAERRAFDDACHVALLNQEGIVNALDKPVFARSAADVAPTLPTVRERTAPPLELDAAPAASTPTPAASDVVLGIGRPEAARDVCMDPGFLVQSTMDTIRAVKQAAQRTRNFTRKSARLEARVAAFKPLLLRLQRNDALVSTVGGVLQPLHTALQMSLDILREAGELTAMQKYKARRAYSARFEELHDLLEQRRSDLVLAMFVKKTPHAPMAAAVDAEDSGAAGEGQQWFSRLAAMWHDEEGLAAVLWGMPTDATLMDEQLMPHDLAPLLAFLCERATRRSVEHVLRCIVKLTASSKTRNALGMAAALGDVEDRRNALVRAGVADAVVCAMRAHGSDAGVQEHGCAAIHNLSAGSDAIRDALMSAGAASAVLRAMRSYGSDASVQEHGCAAFWSLSIGSDARKDALMGAGTAGAVLTAMEGHSGHAGVQEHGCGALWSLSWKSDDRRDALVSAGAVDVVVSAMRVHGSHVGVQEEGCWVIVNLSWKSDDRRDALMSAGAADAVVGAMRAHGSHVGVQEKGCVAIGGLGAGSDAIRDALMDAGAAGAVVGALEGHGSHAGVQEEACWAIANLSWKNDDRRDALMSAGAAGAVVGAMRTHGSHVGVQEHGCAAIGSLGAGSDAIRMR